MEVPLTLSEGRAKLMAEARGLPLNLVSIPHRIREDSGAVRYSLPTFEYLLQIDFPNERKYTYIPPSNVGARCWSIVSRDFPPRIEELSDFVDTNGKFIVADDVFAYGSTLRAAIRAITLRGVNPDAIWFYCGYMQYGLCGSDDMQRLDKSLVFAGRNWSE